MNNRDNFLFIYKGELAKEVEKHPDKYVYPISEVDRIATKMVDSLAKGSANKDSRAIRRTCKHIGIPYTYAGIRQYLTSKE